MVISKIKTAQKKRQRKNIRYILYIMLVHTNKVVQRLKQNKKTCKTFRIGFWIWILKSEIQKWVGGAETFFIYPRELYYSR